MMKKKLLHIESCFEDDNRIKVDLVATIEVDIPPKEEEELLISCRNAFIRKMWIEWGLDLGMATWTTIDDFLNDMFDVHENGIELSFCESTSEINHRFIMVNGYE